ncbi:MAG: hypothetical protein R2736_05655 [Solirubrobacterales bacterium]
MLGRIAVVQVDLRQLLGVGCCVARAHPDMNRTAASVPEVSAVDTHVKHAWHPGGS